jgi:DNA-binding transcriptional LysR family regulator
VRARLKARQLMLLIAIDDEGSTQRAADALNMSQPAASKLLKDLEDTMGVSLFERLPRGMQPTWYGETMIRHARIALSSLSEAGAEIEALKAGYHGNVSVGAITGPAMNLLPAAMVRITRDHPLLRVSLLVESSDVLLEMLSQNKLDIIVARLFARHDKRNLHYEALAEEQVSAIVRRHHPILEIEQPSLAELAVAGWIVPPAGSVLRHRFELMFREEGLDTPANLIETSALLFITKMLQQSDLVAVVAADVARYYAEHGMVAVLPIQVPCNMDSFGLITRSDRLPSPAAKATLRALASAAMSVYGVALEPAGA